MDKRPMMRYTDTMISVGIVEDDKQIREALQDFCTAQPNITCELAEESAESFLAKLSDELLPNVILMDIGLPGMSGISAIKLIKEKYADVDIIMLTIHHDTHKIFQSLCAGATGYLLKTTPFSQIKEAIEVVSSGGSLMSPQIARQVISHFQPTHPIESVSPLTSKEQEVVCGLVDGLSYKMIANNLFVTVDTVRSHIKNIYRKLHVHSKAEVISKSLKGEI
jgi:DNA-binding NarL/FixJ family response regulator